MGKDCKSVPADPEIVVLKIILKRDKNREKEKKEINTSKIYSPSGMFAERARQLSGPDFAIFSPYESVLGAGDRSGPLFPISQRTLPWQPIL